MDNFYDYIRERSSWSGCNTNKWDCEKYLDCDICLQDKIAEHEKRIRAEMINEFLREIEAEWLFRGTDGRCYRDIIEKIAERLREQNNVR